ncbi:MAG: hypothetical protein ACTSQ8_15525 [Candidatus Helarchaeota archaeon]
MRYTKHQEERLIKDLLEILNAFPEGVPTRTLLGTKHFHGMYTPTSKQIHRLLEKQPNVEKTWRGQGYFGSSWWRYKGDK